MHMFCIKRKIIFIQLKFVLIFVHDLKEIMVDLDKKQLLLVRILIQKGANYKLIILP